MPYGDFGHIGYVRRTEAACKLTFGPREVTVASGKCAIDKQDFPVASGTMKSHTRAMIAAATFATVTGKKVAGVRDHASGRDLRIAAEYRDGRLQGFDGDRAASFGGTLPEIHDSGDKIFISMEIDGATAKGFDRGSGGFYEARVSEGLVQVFDHSLSLWFAYDIQDAASASNYHRKAD